MTIRTFLVSVVILFPITATAGWFSDPADELLEARFCELQTSNYSFSMIGKRLVASTGAMVASLKKIDGKHVQIKFSTRPVPLVLFVEAQGRVIKAFRVGTDSTYLICHKD